MRHLRRRMRVLSTGRDVLLNVHRRDLLHRRMQRLPSTLPEVQRVPELRGLDGAGPAEGSLPARNRTCELLRRPGYIALLPGQRSLVFRFSCAVHGGDELGVRLWRGKLRDLYSELYGSHLRRSARPVVWEVERRMYDGGRRVTHEEALR